ncbi:unnamed protein product [Microthlaspi erraticum]|uniref:Uncharacterized protein n=1 Tax=Microthlaspi erraticum TaxID=1685480 RepID=A0A6D2J3V0_9BRAS|nr:unnamed protein product [Microthlaspi erraticum]
MTTTGSLDPSFRTCKKQNMSALSSSEDEYTSATSTISQTVWLRRIMDDVKQEQFKAATILRDNKEPTTMTKNPSYHRITKHTSIDVHFIIDMVVEGSVTLEYCSRNKHSEYVLARALSKNKFDYFRSKLGVCKFESRKSVDM